jgi:hypothetical protein
MAVSQKPHNNSALAVKITYFEWLIQQVGSLTCQPVGTPSHFARLFCQKDVIGNCAPRPRRLSCRIGQPPIVWSCLIQRVWSSPPGWNRRTQSAVVRTHNHRLSEYRGRYSYTELSPMRSWLPCVLYLCHIDASPCSKSDDTDVTLPGSSHSKRKARQR